METKLRHVSEIAVAVGLPKSLANPIKYERFAGKHEAQLAKAVGITQLGVNLVTLEPGAMSSLRHWHEAEDELVYVLDGEMTLVDENGEHVMTAGSVAGFAAGSPNAHHLLNKSRTRATMLVVGSRQRAGHGSLP
jgi:uncharacterized cupin superfamily protein